MIRPYTPISTAETKGHFDLLVKARQGPTHGPTQRTYPTDLPNGPAQRTCFCSRQRSITAAAHAPRTRLAPLLPTVRTRTYTHASNRTQVYEKGVMSKHFGGMKPGDTLEVKARKPGCGGGRGDTDSAALLRRR